MINPPFFFATEGFSANTSLFRASASPVCIRPENNRKEGINLVN
ncbi:hypothetical protein B0I18_107273 [Taibaiella chishuiensis]|uniref:Uncharacterized protein n=1 Tax=Taibaiella chishuiensis TaxID=1434707 RepID=A0A2P8D0V9_9BACT|nr:hypothetical protein B0I18_107273 [Taibaiella chishuiensis]